MDLFVVFTGLVLLAFLVFFLADYYRRLPSSKHRRNINNSKSIHKRLLRFEHDGQVIAYLRKIDPFVFEELLLTSLSKSGYEVLRNRKYTGDGGIDGKVVVRGKFIPIQAKRYKGAVNKKDILDFSKICGHKGLFIHTGKTPKSLNKPSNVDIISGSKLITLIKGDFSI